MDTVLDVHPLFYLGVVVLGIGLARLRGASPKEKPVFYFAAAWGAIVVVFTGQDLVWGPPAEVAAFRRADPARVVAFEVSPLWGRPSPDALVNHTVRIEDRAQVARLVELLRTATHASPNHPGAGDWITELTIDLGAERYTAIVSATTDGLLLRIGGSGVRRDFRQEALKGFLEDAVGRARPK